VRLAVTGDVMELCVLDRGAGFAQIPPEPDSDTEGLGLDGLADRVESLGGRLILRNREGGGAALCMELDLKGQP
jgi:signal transduction histidine kinase